MIIGRIKINFQSKFEFDVKVNDISFKSLHEFTAYVMGLSVHKDSMTPFKTDLKIAQRRMVY